MMDTIKRITENQMNKKVISINSAGKGASGSVYCVELKEEPFKLAVKVSNDYELLMEEKKNA